MNRICADGQIKEYKNGNLSIKFNKDTIEFAEKYDVEALNDILSWADCQFIGDTYCLNNYETGHTIYNSYADVCYIFPWRELENLKQGKTIKLIAHEPDEWDRAHIDEI